MRYLAKNDSFRTRLLYALLRFFLGRDANAHFAGFSVGLTVGTFLIVLHLYNRSPQMTPCTSGASITASCSSVYLGGIE